MKLRLLLSLAILLVVNLSLIVASAFLSVRSTQQHPMLGELIEVQGISLHVVDSGPARSAHTLVLIHGASTSLLDFENSLKPYLQDTFRVISIDRPGHGYSERGNTATLAHLRSDKLASNTPQQSKDPSNEQSQWVSPDLQARLIAEVLAKLDVDSAIWIGHSWAGSVVLAGMLDDTMNVTAGVLIAGATHPWEGAASLPTRMAARPILGPLFSWQYIETLGRLAIDDAVASVFSPEQVPEDYIEDTGVVLSLRPCTFYNNAIDRTHLSDFLTVQSLHYNRINQPLLSITGSKDIIVPAWNHDARLAELVPQMNSVELSGAGHVPHHTRTATVVKAIRQFVESLATTAVNAQSTQKAQ